MQVSRRFQSVGELTGRLLIGMLFVSAGLLHRHAASFYFPFETSVGLHRPEATLPFAYLFEMGAAVLLMLGWKARWAAWTLIFYTVVLTALSQAFGGAAVNHVNELAQVTRNGAILVGLLYFALFGPGEISLDSR